ncbi:hypothetical protein EDC01DRAFT_535153 [Geopyxis carbonaria]|nr:hypothetical protein EDC01DRAFT_535153 [Geopyxis carbonaria]
MVHSVGRVIRGLAIYRSASSLPSNVRTVCPRVLAYRPNVLPLAASYSTKTVTATKKSPATKKATEAAPAAAEKTKSTKANAKTKAKAVVEKPKVAEKKPATPRKKILTDEEKLQNKLQNRIKDVKKIALPKAPSRRALGAWAVFVADEVRGSNSTNPADSFGKIREKFSALTDSQLADLEAKRERINKEREVAYDQWIEQYTVQEIADANNARRWLKKMEVARVDTSPLTDHRKVKRASAAYAFFIQEQLKAVVPNQAPGSGMKEGMKEASLRWKSLSDIEKKPYLDMEAADKKRYAGEKEAQA